MWLFAIERYQECGSALAGKIEEILLQRIMNRHLHELFGVSYDEVGVGDESNPKK